MASSHAPSSRRPGDHGGRERAADRDARESELTDLDVYWTLMGQLRDQTRNLPDGAVVDEVRRQQ